KEIGIAVRHRDVEACPVGALALYLYERWHVRSEPFPDFSSRASWYHLMLLTDGDDNTAGSDGITWGDQAQILKKAFSDLDIATSKVTHAMRGGGARMAFEHGCSEDSIRKHGRWTAGGDQLMERYLTGVALQPVRALAGFSPGGGDYWLPRTLKEPPLSLQQQLWPRIEEVEAAIRQRHRTGGETDQAALNFLAMMKWLRIVLLQDAACLRPLYANLPLWSMAPFNTRAFEQFVSDLTTTISQSVSPIEVTITQLVPELDHALTELRVKQEETSTAVNDAVAEARTERAELRAYLTDMFGLVVAALGESDNAELQRNSTRRGLSTSVRALL
ncbi:hypothetical protein A4X03_0g9394, partial [Tilletia caries]